ncbi:MAG TPA: hypothetical protein G4O13_05785 [Dehalococcoidia bacterium]|nr:hypothetical protein [Dehalococcoidia bacterium]
MSQSDEDKLKVLLDYWIKHNSEHGEEFREWAEKARSMGKASVHDQLLSAAGEMEKVNESLASALEWLERVG